jgi:hypothetical protein
MRNIARIPTKPQAPLNNFELVGREWSRERARRLRVCPSRAAVPVTATSGVVARLIPQQLPGRRAAAHRHSADAEDAHAAA